MISKQFLKKSSLFMSVFLLAVFFDQKLAFAAEETAKTGNLVKGTSEAGHEYDLTEFLKMAENVYDIVVKIAIPCAAVSFAIGAFKMLFGGNEDISRAKSQLIITATAIAGILLLPPFINMGLEIGSNYGWIPKIEDNDTLRAKLTQETIDRHANEREDNKDKDKDKEENPDKDKDSTEEK